MSASHVEPRRACFTTLSTSASLTPSCSQLALSDLSHHLGPREIQGASHISQQTRSLGPKSPKTLEASAVGAKRHSYPERLSKGPHPRCDEARTWHRTAANL